LNQVYTNFVPQSLHNGLVKASVVYWKRMMIIEPV
jgi:hypothetical protein